MSEPSIKDTYNNVADSAAASLARGINKHPKATLGGLAGLQLLGFLIGGSGLAITAGYLLVGFVAGSVMTSSYNSTANTAPAVSRNSNTALSVLKGAAVIQGVIAAFGLFGHNTLGHAASFITAVGLATLYNRTQKLSAPTAKP